MNLAIYRLSPRPGVLEGKCFNWDNSLKTIELLILDGVDRSHCTVIETINPEVTLQLAK